MKGLMAARAGGGQVPSGSYADFSHGARLRSRANVNHFRNDGGLKRLKLDVFVVFYMKSFLLFQLF